MEVVIVVCSVGHTVSDTRRAMQYLKRYSDILGYHSEKIRGCVAMKSGVNRARDPYT